MATFHCSIKHGKVGNGKLHCDYINREGRYASGDKKEELVYKESGNLPSWAESASDFFDAADTLERKNGSAYSEFEVALPNELNLKENVNIIHEFIEKYIGKNKTYALAIHDKWAALDNKKRQPHCHIMFSERIIDSSVPEKSMLEFFRRYNPKNVEEGGYKKDDRFHKGYKNSSAMVNEIRESWASLVNAAYRKAELDFEVTHLSNEQQINNAIMKKDYELLSTINSNQTQHLGPKIANEMLRNLKEKKPFEIMSDKAQYYFLTKRHNEIKNSLKQNEIYISNLRDLKDKEIHNVDDFKKSLREILNNYRAVLLNEKHHEVSKEKCKNEKEKILISGYELSKKITDSCINISEKLKENQKKIFELEKEIVPRKENKKSEKPIVWKRSENWKRLQAYALSIYTKGATKRVNDEAKKLKIQRKKFEAEWNNFIEMGNPNLSDNEARKAYQKKKQGLDKWQKQLLVDEQANFEKVNIIKNELRKPEHRRNIARILLTLRNGNNAKIRELNQLRSENKEIKAVGRRLLYVQKQCVKLVNYRVSKDLIFYLENKESHSIEEVLRNLKRAANTLEAHEKALSQGNNMKINFHDDSIGGMKI